MNIDNGLNFVNKEVMDDKNLNMLDAAVATFARYGVKRATMSDIADEAGISRQTLYSSFPSKDEMLAAAILHMSEGILTQVRAGWEDATNISEQLDVYFEHAVIAVFEMIKSSPDADDIAGKYTELRKETVVKASVEAGKLKQHALAEKLSPFQKEIAESGQTCEQLVEFIYTAAKSFENAATTTEELRSLLISLKISVLRTIQYA